MSLFGKPHTNVSITTETILRTIVLTISAFLLLQFVGEVTHQLRLIAVSGFLAIGLNPAVSWITQKLKSKSRPRATGFAYILVLSILIGMLVLIVPALVSQFSEFARDLPNTINNFSTQDSVVADWVRKYNLDEQLARIGSDISSSTGSLVDPLLNTATRAIGTIVSIITVLVLTFMMLIEGPVLYGKILALQPKSKQAHFNDKAKRMYRVITSYVNGQVLIAAISASFTLIALVIASTLFNVTVNAVALAAITFFFALIPLIGTTIGASIVVLMALFASSGLALTMAIYFLVYQQIENSTLQPYIQSRGNQLTPMLVFIAALLGAGLGGLLGALAAIPIAGCLRILLEDALEKRRSA